jgi:hypothetical protein
MPNFEDCDTFMWSISGRSHSRLTSGSTPLQPLWPHTAILLSEMIASVQVGCTGHVLYQDFKLSIS